MAKPAILPGMKYKFNGEFSWKDEVPKWDKELEEYIDDTELVERIVPWTLVKDIYQQMTMYTENLLTPGDIEKQAKLNKIAEIALKMHDTENECMTLNDYIFLKGEISCEISSYNFWLITEYEEKQNA